MRTTILAFGLSFALVTSSMAVLAEEPVSLDPRVTIELFAAEPDIVTPVGIALDAQGRVLVVESHTHFRPEDYDGPPSDRVRAFEDTTGDGRADRVTTVFEGTEATMNVAVYRDGSLFVATRNEVFRLHDTNGDGVYDRREPIARLETPGNYPHNGLCGFTFDFHGDVYFGMGENLGEPYDLIGADGTTLSGGGEGGNVYRCRPDGSGLTRIATGFWNPFGMTFDAFGRLFVVDNDPDSRPPCRLLHVVEGSDFGFRFRNGRKGLHPFTAWDGELPGTLPMVAGTAEAPSDVIVYEALSLPEEYHGTVLTTSWGDHRIERFRLRPEGASFRAEPDAIIVGGEDFRPVGLAVASDGSIYVSDWVDRSYDLHQKGRVWRIRGVEPRDAGADRNYALDHPDRSIRERTARRLAESGPEGANTLRATVRTHPDPNARAVALHALAARDLPADEAFRAALRDASADVRALAVRLAPSRLLDPKAIAEHDKSALVRAEALRRIADSDGLPALRDALLATDPFLLLATREGLRRSVDLADLIALSQSERPEHRIAALLLLKESGDPAAREPLPALLADPDPTVRQAAIQWVGDEVLTEYRQALTDGLFSGAMTRALFEAYVAALERLDGRTRALRDEIGGEQYVAEILENPQAPDEVRRWALRVLRPDHPSLTLDLLRTLLDSPNPDLQLEAVRSLREGPHPERLDLLAELASGRHPVVLRAEALVGLSGDDPRFRDRLVAFAQEEDGPVRHEALRSLRGAELTDAQRQALADLAARDPTSADLVALLLDVDPNLARVRPPTADLEAWLTRLDGPADPEAGERVFFHPKGPGCFRCHQVEGRGGRAGPDLTTTGEVLARPRLVESILEPSREIAPQFVTWLIATTDGTVATGAMLGFTAEGDQIFADAEGELFTVNPLEIEERRPLTTSIMPEDLASMMTDQEFRDLLAFLARPRSGEDGRAETAR